MGARIVELARAERAAEESKGRADAAWRAAWWDLTLALAALPRAEVTEALNAAERELGQTRQWLHARRGLGNRIDLTVQGKIHKVWPGMARALVEWGGERQITRQIVDELLAAEAAGKSVRDLIQAWTERDGRPMPITYRPRGEIVPDGYRTRDPDRSPEVREAIVRQELQERPETIAEVIEQHPEVARSIARQMAERPAARRQLDDARQEVARERLASAGITGPSPERDETDDLLVARHELAKATGAVRTAFERLVDLDLDAGARSALAGDAQRLTRWVELVTERINSGSWDAELRALLDAEA